MTRRRWRRMELERPARDAVVVRESTVVVRFPFSRARSRVERPARHFVLHCSRPVYGPERRGSGAGGRERSFGSLDRRPSLRIDKKNPEAEQAFCQMAPRAVAQGNARRRLAGRANERTVRATAADWLAVRAKRRTSRVRPTIGSAGEPFGRRSASRPPVGSLGEPDVNATARGRNHRAFQELFRNGP